jgi:tetrahydromethanopterin S-methyltransferase subunit H
MHTNILYWKRETLFGFEKPQEIFRIGNVELGGQPGELPTVLIGSIFFYFDKIVENKHQGIFKKKEAKKLIDKVDNLSMTTGNPYIIDIEAITNTAIEKYIDFISEVTESPFFVNSTNVPVRLHGANYVNEIGLLDRAIYASINFTAEQNEFDVLKQAKIENVLVQAFNPKNPFTKGMMKMMKEGLDGEGLVEKVISAGIKTPLLFANVYDVPSIGVGCETVYMLKKEFGLPSGTAPVGVVGIWGKTEKAKDISSNISSICGANAAAFAKLKGSDFIHYGSLKRADKIYPAVSMIDAIIAYRAHLSGLEPKNVTPALQDFLDNSKR